MDDHSLSLIEIIVTDSDQQSRSRILRRLPFPVRRLVQAHMGYQYQGLADSRVKAPGPASEGHSLPTDQQKIIEDRLRLEGYLDPHPRKGTRDTSKTTTRPHLAYRRQGRHTKSSFKSNNTAEDTLCVTSK
jgi:hypothetical protein